MFNNDAFNQTRANAEITDSELADFIGESRESLWKITLCKAPATAGHWAALRAMIAEKNSK
jgi:hypothetical protein